MRLIEIDTLTFENRETSDRITIGMLSISHIEIDAVITTEPYSTLWRVCREIEKIRRSLDR